MLLRWGCVGNSIVRCWHALYISLNILIKCLWSIVEYFFETKTKHLGNELELTWSLILNSWRNVILMSAEIYSFSYNQVLFCL